LLVKDVASKFGERVRVKIENWGDSRIAKRLGVSQYPAVFVGESIFAGPRDLGFYGAAGQGGRYTPWRDPANHEKFRKDLARAIETALAGGAAAPGGGGAGGNAEIAGLPEFRLIDLAGKEIASADLRGRPAVVEFWASWCVPCRKTLTWLAEEKRRRGDALTVVAIAVESEESKVKEVVAGLEGIGVALGSPEIAVAFGDLMSIPTTFLFDREGKTASVHHGAPEDLHERLGKEIAAALR
jgi:thiol-disulfide isomerase/thioredoxin